MIAAPANDRACLGKLSALAALATTLPAVRELASRFSTTAELVDWVRS